MLLGKRRIVAAMCEMGLFLCLSAPPSTARPVDVEGWRSDVDFVVDKVESVHPQPWMRIAEDDFKSNAAKLKGDIPHLTEEEITVRLMQLVASLGDGHTDLLPVGRPEFALWFPVRLDHLFDGIFITAISEEHADLLGAQVLRVGGMAAEDAYERVGSAASADSRCAWPKAVPPLFSNATILKALQIVESDELPLEVRIDGKRRTVRMRAVSWRADFGWTLWGFRAPGGVEHASVYTYIGDREENLPLHLRHLRQRRFWFEFLPQHRTLYLQFNSVNNSRDETLEQFTRRLWDFYESHSGEIDKFVLDLRYNPGGNGYLLRPFIHGFIRHDKVNKRGALYAITGPGTFSAASNCLGQMIRHTEIIVVGEAASGPLNWCSDTQILELPHSRLPLRVSTLCWQEGHPSDNRGYFPPEQLIPTLASDLFAGKDRAMEAILSGEVRPLADILLGDGSEAFMAEYDRLVAEYAGVHCWFPYLQFDLAKLGFDMLGSQRYDEGVAAFRLNTMRYPQSARTWEDLGDGYRANGDREQAINSYERSLELNPQNTYVRHALQEQLFHSAYERGGVDEAIRIYRKARGSDPQAYNEDAVNGLGYYFLREGNTADAIEVFALNAEAYPESWNVWDSLAEAYMEDGQIELAIRYYEKSLELNPGNANAREVLSRIREEKGAD